MNKKEYISPIVNIVKLRSFTILAASPIKLSRGHADEEQSVYKPRPDEMGIIWVETRRQDGRVIDDEDDGMDY